MPNANIILLAASGNLHVHMYTSKTNVRYEQCARYVVVVVPLYHAMPSNNWYRRVRPIMKFKQERRTRDLEKTKSERERERSLIATVTATKAAD